MLTFVADEGSPGRWEPADAQSGALLLIGDVTGTTDATVVQRILGRQVIHTADTPSEGQVLKFTNNAWRPGRDEVGGGATELKGDVRGPSDNNRIDLLQGTLVKAEAPQSGQVLTYIEDEEGNSWRPAEQHDRRRSHPPVWPADIRDRCGGCRARRRPERPNDVQRADCRLNLVRL